MMQSDDAVAYDRTFDFHPWVTTLLLLSPLPALLAGIWGGEESRRHMMIPLSIAVGVVLLVFALVMRMRVVVVPGEVRIFWGWLQAFRVRIPLHSVESFRVVTYRPIRDFGGWGVRVGRGGSRCYNTRGNRGVELILNRKSRVIGVDDPEVLAAALEMVTGRRAAPAGDFQP